MLKWSFPEVIWESFQIDITFTKFVYLIFKITPSLEREKKRGTFITVQSEIRREKRIKLLNTFSLVYKWEERGGTGTYLTKAFSLQQSAALVYTMFHNFLHCTNQSVSIESYDWILFHFFQFQTLISYYLSLRPYHQIPFQNVSWVESILTDPLSQQCLKLCAN